jgi:hypothetical protein
MLSINAVVLRAKCIGSGAICVKILLLGLSALPVRGSPPCIYLGLRRRFALGYFDGAASLLARCVANLSTMTRYHSDDYAAKLRNEEGLGRSVSVALGMDAEKGHALTCPP